MYTPDSTVSYRGKETLIECSDAIFTVQYLAESLQLTDKDSVPPGVLKQLQTAWALAVLESENPNMDPTGSPRTISNKC
jgi:hypothetical protein